MSVFDFTLKEARGVLTYAREQHRRNELWKSRPGTVGAFFYSIGATTAHIDLEIQRLEENLRHVNVLVYVSPPHDEHRYVIDENELQEAIISHVPNYRESAMKHDMQAIAAVMRIRRGRARDSFEECRAVFATLNSPLLLASKEVDDLKSEPWYVVMHEIDVATLAWIKSPPSSPNFPRQLLLASCLGIIQPSETSWTSYMTEIENLYTKAEITTQDLVIARQAIERPRTLVSVNGTTVKLADRIKASIVDFKTQLRAEIENPLVSAIEASNEEMQKLSASLVETKRELSEFKKRESEIQASRTEKAAKRNGIIDKIANIFSKLISAALCVVVIAGTTFPSFAERSVLQTYAFRIVVVVVFIFGDHFIVARYISQGIAKFLKRKFAIK